MSEKALQQFSERENKNTVDSINRLVQHINTRGATPLGDDKPALILSQQARNLIAHFDTTVSNQQRSTLVNMVRKGEPLGLFATITLASLSYN